MSSLSADDTERPSEERDSTLHKLNRCPHQPGHIQVTYSDSRGRNRTPSSTVERSRVPLHHPRAVRIHCLLPDEDCNRGYNSKEGKVTKHLTGFTDRSLQPDTERLEDGR